MISPVLTVYFPRALEWPGDSLHLPASSIVLELQQLPFSQGVGKARRLPSPTAESFSHAGQSSSVPSISSRPENYQEKVGLVHLLELKNKRVHSLTSHDSNYFRAHVAGAIFAVCTTSLIPNLILVDMHFLSIHQELYAVFNSWSLHLL